MNMDLHQLRVFQEVVAHMSFSRAAASLQTSRGRVTKIVAQLERVVGVRLLNRSTRSVSLTDAGETLAGRLEPIFNLIDDVRMELSDLAAHPRGRLRLAAPHGLSLNALGKNIEDFIARYPDVHVSLHLNNRQENLVGGAIDVAFQIGPIPHSDLIVRKLRPIALVLCASPQYWSRRGIPTSPEELKAHDVLTYSLWDPAPRLPFVVGGEIQYVDVKSRLDADDVAPLIALALKGLGVICVPEVLARRELGCGNLVPVLQDALPQSMWLYAAYAHRNHKSAALRALLDFLGTG